MSQQLKYAGGLQINLLGTPPSDGDIIGARQRAAAQAEGEARDERRGEILGISLAMIVFAPLVFALVVPEMPGWLRVTVVGFCVIAFWCKAVQDRSHDKWLMQGLQPARPTQLTQVVAACLMDPRVDRYRQQVALLDRDLLQVEADAFSDWADRGYRHDQVKTLVRSRTPMKELGDIEGVT